MRTARRQLFTLPPGGVCKRIHEHGPGMPLHLQGPPRSLLKELPDSAGDAAHHSGRLRANTRRTRASGVNIDEEGLQLPISSAPVAAAKRICAQRMTGLMRLKSSEQQEPELVCVL